VYIYRYIVNATSKGFPVERILSENGARVAPVTLNAKL